jgi:hypothetical protein
MTTKSKRVLMHNRIDTDEILRAVLSDIHRSAEKPPPGYLTRQQWATKWKLKAAGTAEVYLLHAVKIGKLQRLDFRIVTKKRLRKMAHFGPPTKSKAP